jgi:hypothetical protein
MTILVLVLNCLPTYRRSPLAGSNRAQRHNPHPVNYQSIDRTIKIVLQPSEPSHLSITYLLTIF